MAALLRKAQTSRCSWIVALAMLPLAVSSSVSSAQPLDQGVAFLVSSQQADGSWDSSRVRREQATTEALRALQTLGREAASQSAAADFLEAEPPVDHDDRGRRLLVLAAAGRDVASLVSALTDGADPRGGWGLTEGFTADPLDTALVTRPLSDQLLLASSLLQNGLRTLLVAQNDDGGWSCIAGRQGDGESDLFCTSHILQAVLPFRTLFFLDDEVGPAVDFLRGQLNADGSFGPPGPNAVIQTALASLTLTEVPALGAEVAGIRSFLESRQSPDGSWDGDPYTTALALRALDALAQVPFCGDGLINQPGEACDGLDLGGATCEGVGLGAGTLTCSDQCTLDTSGCSALPVCGDNLRNQDFEVCDGTDLAAQTCQSLGFPSGDLACASDCLSFDVSSCEIASACGDGVVNQPGEICDINDLQGATCESLGLGGGQLRCAPDCNLDTTQCDAAGFEIDNKGREFFVGFMRNLLTDGTAAVHLTSDVPTSATVQYPVNNPSFSQTVAVNPGAVSIVNLPRNAHNGWTTGVVLDNAVRVSAPDEIVVYPVHRRPATSDAGMALPVDALGTSYIVVTARGSLVVGTDRSQFLVVAAFDDTTVTITPTAELRALGVNRPPGVPFDITLSRGQGLRTEARFARADLTGTRIEASRPVAVVNGNVCTNIPGNVTFCDHIFEVAHPLRSWGTSALVTNLPNRPGGSVYRVVASEDDTEIRLDGIVQTTLDRGGLFETAPLAGNHVFDADQPIFVTQFMTGDSFPGALQGDPAMANMIPPDQYLESYTFSTVGGGQFASHFLTLTAPDNAVGSVLLDGTPIDPAEFSPLPGSGFSTTVLPLPEGSHTTSSPEPHGITVEGINAFDSYIYPGGARLELINPFCGDGRVNLSFEQCDGSDFDGANCSTFGFSSGFLVCTAACTIDTSQCSGISSEDDDEDGFPSTEDCDDSNPDVNPGQTEIPGNGIDDDCNPGTPDVIPEATVACELVTDQITYDITDLVLFEAAVENTSEALSLTGLTATLVVRDATDATIFSEARPLAPLPPGARSLQDFVFETLGNAPGNYQAELVLLADGTSQAQCAASFAIDNSAETGAGLSGTLTLDPEVVNAGDPSDATYTVQNDGNATLVDLGLRILLLDPEMGEILAELTDGVTLAPDDSFSATQAFSTVGLDSNKSYLAVLIAVLGEGLELTLDDAVLTVVNVPPDCSGAFADPGSLWPPNHGGNEGFVEIAIEGVTDEDGDPITLTVNGVLQDEPVDDTGDGAFCPDASGIGTSTAKVRAERSGTGDGRVYHIRFTADDGRGGTCEGTVTVCVPHDQGNGGVCTDQGALFTSTACP